MPFIRIFGLINAFVVENVRQQRELERHEHVSPLLSSDGGLLHRVLASRFAKDIGFSDGELPALERSLETMDHDFGAEALPIQSGEVHKMATYVAGGDPREDIEVVVQRWLARRFRPRYEANDGVRDAARLIGGWHRRGALTALASIWGGRLNDAKALIAASVPPDLHVAYAPTVLLPYIVKCLERMRQIACDPSVGESLSAEMVVAGSLTPPRFVFRTCTKEVAVSFARRRLPADTLVILPARRLGAAGDGSSAFGSEDTSRYPAMRLIRRLLTQVWVASREVHNPAVRSVSAVTERLSPQQVAAQRAAALRAVAQRAAAQRAASPSIGEQPTVAQPSAMQEMAESMQPTVVLQPKVDLASLTRTLPFGNDLGTQRRRVEKRRGQRRRSRRKQGATVPGPY